VLKNSWIFLRFHKMESFGLIGSREREMSFEKNRTIIIINNI